MPNRLPSLPPSTGRLRMLAASCWVRVAQALPCTLVPVFPVALGELFEAVDALEVGDAVSAQPARAATVSRAAPISDRRYDTRIMAASLTGRAPENRPGRAAMARIRELPDGSGGSPAPSGTPATVPWPGRDSRPPG